VHGAVFRRDGPVVAKINQHTSKWTSLQDRAFFIDSEAHFCVEFVVAHRRLSHVLQAYLKESYEKGLDNILSNLLASIFLLSASLGICVPTPRR